MGFTRYIIVLLAVGAMLCGCKPSDEAPALEQAAPQAPPLALVVQKELKGTVFGASLSEPFGVVVSRDKRIYLSDAGNHRILLFDSLLTPLQQRGGYGGSAGQLNRPGYMALDNNFNLLVAEQGNRRISFFNSRLDYVTEIAMRSQDDPLKFGAPSGVAVRHGGEIWVSEPDNNRLDVFSYAGLFDRFMADYNAGTGVRNPAKVLTTNSGSLLVCDAGNRRIAFLDDFGNDRTQIRYRGFEHPVAATANTEYTWVVDDHTHQLFLFSRDDTFLASFGPSLTGSGLSLKNPTDVAFLGDDQLIIVDNGNDRVLLCKIYWSQDESDRATAQ